MANFHPHDLIDNIVLESVHVHPPTSVVFLCGGLIDSTSIAPKCLRDAFYRESQKNNTFYQITLAEKAEPLTSDAGYHDLLSFESDIAQVVGLILLFAESAGSLAELGAFAALGTVSPNLLAVLDDHYYKQSSFIRNGPVKYLEHTYGPEQILVLDRQEVGINPDGTISKIDADKLYLTITSVIQDRLTQKKQNVKFSAQNNGHKILLITGLCQEFGALKKAELITFLKNFSADVDFNNAIYCAELLGWIKTVRKGNHIFYVTSGGDSALDYKFKPETPVKDKTRWRSDIRNFWRDHDGARFRAISEVNAEVQKS